MLLVIDGYNLLKQRSPGQIISEKQRQAFIAELASYTQKKHHEIVLVFDGGPYDWPQQERKSGIRVVYSGIQETADDYIKKLLEDHHNADVLLVSSDHELGLFAAALEVPSINAMDFYSIVKQTITKTVAVDVPNKGGLVKLQESTDATIDDLMQAAAQLVEVKDEDLHGSIELPQKKSRISRRERKLLAQLKKL